MTDRLKFGLALVIVLAVVIDIADVFWIGLLARDSPLLFLEGGSTAQFKVPDAETLANLMANLNLRLKASSPSVSTRSVGADRLLLFAPGLAADRLKRELRSSRIDLVRWIADPSIQASNYTPAGYRPQLTGIGSDQFASLQTYHDQKYGWTAELDFRPEATDQLTQLTTALSQACPGSQDCQLSHLSLFVDLTSTELDHWNTFALYAGAPVESGGQLVDEGPVSEPFNTAAISWSGFDSAGAADAFAAYLDVGAVPSGVEIVSITAVPPLPGRLPARIPLAILIAVMVGALCWGLAALAFLRPVPTVSA